MFEPDPEPVVATVEIVIPVYNEQDALARSVRQLHAFLSKGFPVSWHITIADNASTDRTWAIACQLAQSLDHVRAAHLDGKGRGRALRALQELLAAPHPRAVRGRAVDPRPLPRAHPATCR